MRFTQFSLLSNVNRNVQNSIKGIFIAKEFDNFLIILLRCIFKGQIKCKME